MELGPGALEALVVNPEFWSGRRVLVTGHTGFKGSWLTLWLHELGAMVSGYALKPPTEPNLFTVARLESCLIQHCIGDVRDLAALTQAMHSAQPEVVFHLAAQPLVRLAYRDPVATYAVNVLGTVHLLEAVRCCPSVRAVVVVTSDKCYEDRRWAWPYRENDRLGGHEPYAGSKAAAELVVHTYRHAFLSPSRVAVASVRAGNVIGGGDWAEDRLLPDILRASAAGVAVRLRSPQAIRPWQHVLEPLAGYLLLAERLYRDEGNWASAWNFGPDPIDHWPVERVTSWLCERLGCTWESDADPHPRETHLLSLDSSQARLHLGWAPHWSLEKALEQTLAWYQAWRRGADMQALSRQQIRDYQASQTPLSQTRASRMANPSETS
ncbi:CDP-glucose 4,6-dehydratase [Caldichromatium japonicum]|uniref:CDP-glucose 4,6-dehydratase n=1 Tax=Caldichromatium japonicum TaxID=2699430 RepID=A0A6G7VD69_9GAMM|nr:CDP-glucose 4,6-dehydratase [Caldichromatium japonicum]QIK37999.1 CDP-glucose 4,6-dehydratase [Caldichromatium japonicum]